MKGDTLIEVLIALAAAVVVISTITTLAIVTLNNAQFSRDQDQSTKYAQEGMEVIRGIRNNNYVGFRSYSGKYCLAEGDTSLGSPVAACNTVNVINKYIRFVTIAQNSGCGAVSTNLTNIVITVLWTDGKCTGGAYCHSSKLTSCFSTVPPVSAP